MLGDWFDDVDNRKRKNVAITVVMSKLYWDFYSGRLRLQLFVKPDVLLLQFSDWMFTDDDEMEE